MNLINIKANLVRSYYITISLLCYDAAQMLHCRTTAELKNPGKKSGHAHTTKKVSTQSSHCHPPLMGAY